jgi:hypothetical protein
MFITLVHDLVTGTYGARRAFTGTFFTFGTKILEPEINGLVNQKRKVSRHNSRFKSWSQKRMENAVSNPAHFAKTCPEKDGRERNLVVSSMMGPRRIAKTTDILCYDTGNKA